MRKQILVDRIETRGRRGNIGGVGAALLKAARVEQPVREAQITVSYERVQRKVDAMCVGCDGTCPVCDGVFPASEDDEFFRAAEELGIDLTGYYERKAAV